jgi:hypothetical protein
LAAAVIGLLLFVHVQLSAVVASVKRRLGIETIAAVHRGHSPPVTGPRAAPWTVPLRFDNATPLAGRPAPAHDEPKGRKSLKRKTGRVRAEPDQSEELQ